MRGARVSFISVVGLFLLAITVAPGHALAACNWQLSTGSGSCASGIGPPSDVCGVDQPNGTVMNGEPREGVPGFCSAQYQCVCTSTQPDLTASNTGISPSSATVNQSVTFTATVSNAVGAATATDFPNNFQIADAGISITLDRANAGTISSLAGGASTGISGSYTFTSAGTYNVRACANFNSSGSQGIAESNPGNNCSNWVAITVSASAPITTPDLTIQSKAFINGTPFSGDYGASVGATISFSATVSNIGSGSTGTGFNNLWQVTNSYNGGGSVINPSGTNGTSNGTTAINSAVANNASASSNYSYTFSTVGTYSVRACADTNSSWAGTIAESDENNNCGPWQNIGVTGAGSLPTVNIYFQ